MSTSRYFFRPPVFPDLTEWPIFKLHQDRKNFVREIVLFTMDRIKADSNGEVDDLIAKTIFQERIRIKEEPWKVDPPDERQFWNRTQKKLMDHSIGKDNIEADEVALKLLEKIVTRYAEEIVGTFKISTFLFARKFLVLFFGRLLNAAAGKGKPFRRWFSNHMQLHEKLVAKGDIDTIRSLMKEGTVVVVPTHSSNLDSILVGFVMDAVLGLPSFSYGAGLNLYNTGYTAYYMNRLGAYRVDRRKKNPIYLETLKSMSNLSIQRGTNSLFFPGGTRSRSGSLETHLKLGLLGTAVEAQRHAYQNGSDNKVFIVPVVLCYHSVLEAKSLIEQQLANQGKERYYRGKMDKFSVRRFFRFVWNTFSQSSEILISFGKPMDVLGNFVDPKGLSYDRFKRPLDVKDYFLSDGEVNTDLQRESVYTKILADRVVDRYHKENYVLSSHLVAYAAFQMLKHEHPKLDLYGLLRLPADEFRFPKSRMIKAIVAIQKHLIKMEDEGKLRLSTEIRFSAEECLKDGINYLGTFHPEKALKIDTTGWMVSEDLKLLYFYHNRLSTYHFDAVIPWKTMVEQELIWMSGEEV